MESVIGSTIIFEGSTGLKRYGEVIAVDAGTGMLQVAWREFKDLADLYQQKRRSFSKIEEDGAAPHASWIQPPGHPRLHPRASITMMRAQE